LGLDFGIAFEGILNEKLLQDFIKAIKEEIYLFNSLKKENIKVRIEKREDRTDIWIEHIPLTFCHPTDIKGTKEEYFEEWYIPLRALEGPVIKKPYFSNVFYNIAARFLELTKEGHFIHIWDESSDFISMTLPDKSGKDKAIKICRDYGKE
jgi:hypothetical protein